MIPTAPFLLRKISPALLPQPYRRMWNSAVVIQTFPTRANKVLYRPAGHLTQCRHDGGGTSGGYVVTDVGPALYHPGTAASNFMSDPLEFLHGQTTWSPFTIALLLNRVAGDNFDRYCLGGDAGNIDWTIGEITGPLIRFTSNNTGGASDVIAASVNHASNVWFTAIGTWDGTTKRLYKDGVLQGTSTPSNIRARSGNTNSIRWAQGTSGFTGYYGIIVLCRGAWSLPEINAFTNDPWGFFRPYGVDRLTVEEFSYFLPISTIASGDWSAVGAGTLHEAIDEIPVSDSDYIEYTPANPDPNTVKFGLTNISTGVGLGDVTLVIRTEATEL